MTLTCTIVTHRFNGFAVAVEIGAGAEKDKGLFTDETLVSLVGLGQTLRRIRTRLLSEGYVIRKGIIEKKPANGK